MKRAFARGAAVAAIASLSLLSGLAASFPDVETPSGGHALFQLTTAVASDASHAVVTGRHRFSERTKPLFAALPSLALLAIALLVGVARACSHAPHQRRADRRPLGRSPPAFAPALI